jgi:patatin-related protein
MSTATEKPVERKPPEGVQDDPKSLETRFGLVMYGGVSLAIYINGVAREFFRAVRGAGVYKLIKALTDRDVVVDVISGTSAGGINGIMLGYALCNQKDFASCASLWRLDGDVRSLLRSPYVGADAADSLFDSEGYYQPRLEAAFSEMPDYVGEEGEINSTFPELDLFVTGTDVDGNISTQFDDSGHPIDVKDHRSVFLLKHRQGRKHPFEPGSALDGPSPPEATYQALAKLARITSCFPAAFTPVHVGGSEPPGNATMDGKLRLWGRRLQRVAA